MKIFVVEPYTRTAGHFERLPVRTCEAFARLGNTVTLVSYGGISADWFEGLRPFEVADAAPHGATDLDARYRNGKLDFTSLRSFVKRTIREFQTFRLTASLLPREDLSIVHLYDADPIPLTFAMKMLQSNRGGEKPVIVLTIHEIARLKHFSGEQIVRLGLARRLRRRVYRWTYRHLVGRLIKYHLDGVAVLDVSVKQGLLSHFKLGRVMADRIRVLPHGIGDPVKTLPKEQARRGLNLDLAETIFLVFGVLRKDKRIDLAIEAIQGLPHCRLVIAGAAQDFTEATIKDLLQRHACEGSVSTEIDHIPERRMHDYFSACDAVIIPYDKSFTGLSGILTLACAHGRAVIASDVTLLGDTVKEHGLGFTVEPENPIELRKAMLRFFSLTSEERAQLEQRVCSYAGLMSWDSACAQWVEFYRELLSRRKLHPEG